MTRGYLDPQSPDWATPEARAWRAKQMAAFYAGLAGGAVAAVIGILLAM